MFEKLIKFAFIDRDGTIIYEPTPNDTKLGDIPYQVDSLEKLRILPGVIRGLQKILQAGYRLVMTTNQDGLGTNTYPQDRFVDVQAEIIEVLSDNGIVFEYVFVCPHLPQENCVCRKPKTGLFFEFLLNTKIDKKMSFVCGDRVSDRQLAKNLGIRFLPIKTNGVFQFKNFNL